MNFGFLHEYKEEYSINLEILTNISYRSMIAVIHNFSSNMTIIIFLFQ